MAKVSGHVIDEATNTPVAGAHVFVVVEGENPMPPGPSSATVSDRDGRYRFDALPAGRYHLAAQKEGFAPPMGPTPLDMFELSAHQVLEGVTVALRRGGVITGRVLDPRGDPAAEVSVTALLKRLITSDRATGPIPSGAPVLMPSGHSAINALGEFRIGGLWPGEYIVAANPRVDFAAAPASTPSRVTIPTSTFFPDTADLSAAQPVTVDEGESVSDLTIRLVAVPVFRISGVVVDEAGTPLTDVTVMLMAGGAGSDVLLSLSMGPRGMSQSDAAGRFTFEEVPAGSYTLRASRGLGGFFFTTEDFLIGGDGTPRVVADGPEPSPASGTLDVIVGGTHVDDLRLVLPASRT